MREREIKEHWSQITWLGLVLRCIGGQIFRRDLTQREERTISSLSLTSSRTLVNACPLCLEGEETVDHLLRNCKVVQGLWHEVLSWFDCCCTHPSSILGLFEAWHLEVGSDIRRVIWRMAFPAVTWIIWKERRLRCFEDYLFSRGSCSPIEALFSFKGVCPPSIPRGSFHYFLRAHLVIFNVK